MTIAHKEALLPFRKRPWLVFPVRPRSRERSFLLYNERLLKTSCSLTPDLEQDKKMIMLFWRWPIGQSTIMFVFFVCDPLAKFAQTNPVQSDGISSRSYFRLDSDL